MEELPKNGKLEGHKLYFRLLLEESWYASPEFTKIARNRK